MQNNIDSNRGDTRARHKTCFDDLKNPIKFCKTERLSCCLVILCMQIFQTISFKNEFAFSI